MSRYRSKGVAEFRRKRALDLLQDRVERGLTFGQLGLKYRMERGGTRKTIIRHFGPEALRGRLDERAQTGG